MRWKILVVVIAVAACTTPAPIVPARAPCVNDTVGAHFFQNTVFDAYDTTGFKANWYGDALAAMGEPPLSCGPATADEAYRFLWLRSFHPDIAIRASRTGSVYRLRATEMKRASGDQAGYRSTNRVLSRTEWSALKAALDRADFWIASTSDPAMEDRIALDGAQWIFEGRSERYHVIDRFAGGGKGITDLGLVFVELSRLQIPKSEIY